MLLQVVAQADHEHVLRGRALDEVVVGLDPAVCQYTEPRTGLSRIEWKRLAIVHFFSVIKQKTQSIALSREYGYNDSMRTGTIWAATDFAES